MKTLATCAILVILTPFVVFMSTNQLVSAETFQTV